MHHGHGSGWLSHDSVKQVELHTVLVLNVLLILTLWASALEEGCIRCPTLPALTTGHRGRREQACFTVLSSLSAGQNAPLHLLADEYEQTSGIPTVTYAGAATAGGSECHS